MLYYFWLGSIKLKWGGVLHSIIANMLDSNIIVSPHFGHANCLYWESFLRWGFLIWELFFSFIYCGPFVLILVVFSCFFFSTFRPNFTSGLLQVINRDLGMLILVTVSPVITAFHSCCLLHHVFRPSKPLTGLGRNWNRYLLTMLTWNGRDSTPLTAAQKKDNSQFSHDIMFPFRLIFLEKAWTPQSP